MKHQTFKPKLPKRRVIYKPPADPRYLSAQYKRAKRLRSSDTWKKIQREKIQRDPVCEWCGIKHAEEVHHIEGVTKAPDKFNEPSNLMSVCKRCHVLIEGAIKRGIDIVAMKKEMNNHAREQ